MAAHPIRASIWLALAYIACCGGYIVLSSKLAASASWTVDQLYRFELIKGLVFIGVSGLAYFAFAFWLLRRIAQQQEHLYLLFHGVSDAIFLLRIDPDGGCRLLNANTSFLHLTGLTHRSVTGRRIEEVLPQASVAMATEKFEEAITTRATVSWQGVGVFPAGERVCEFRVAPLADKTGRIVQLAGVIRDTTARTRAEEALRNAHDKLEQLVAERTAALQATNEDLRATAAELARSNADLEQFAAAAAHDLQAPLRHVGSFTQLLAGHYRGRLNADADKWIHSTLDGVKRMQQLIAGLLSYARVSKGQPTRERVDADAALQLALQHLSAALS